MVVFNDNFVVVIVVCNVIVVVSDAPQMIVVGVVDVEQVLCGQ